MLQHLLRVPFQDQAEELTLADLAKERRVEKRQASLKIEVPVEPGCVVKRKCLKDINGLEEYRLRLRGASMIEQMVCEIPMK